MPSSAEHRSEEETFLLSPAHNDERQQDALLAPGAPIEKVRILSSRVLLLHLIECWANDLAESSWSRSDSIISCDAEPWATLGIWDLFCTGVYPSIRRIYWFTPDILVCLCCLCIRFVEAYIMINDYTEGEVNSWSDHLCRAREYVPQEIWC